MEIPTYETLYQESKQRCPIQDQLGYAHAWFLVVRTLDFAYPGWYTLGSSGMESAYEAIRRLAEAANKSGQESSTC